MNKINLKNLLFSCLRKLRRCFWGKGVWRLRPSCSSVIIANSLVLIVLFLLLRKSLGLIILSSLSFTGTTGDFWAVTSLSMFPKTCLCLSPCPPASKTPSQVHEPQKVLLASSEVQPLPWSPAGLKGLITNVISFLLCSIF